MKDIQTTTCKLSRLIAARTNASNTLSESQIEMSLANYVLAYKPIEQNIFIYRIKEAELVNTILNNLHSSIEAAKASNIDLVKEVKQERAKSNIGLSVNALAAILGSALVFKQLKGYSFPFLGDIAHYFKSESNVLTLIERNTNSIKELASFELVVVPPEFPEIDSQKEPDRAEEEQSDESSLVQEALDRIYGAKSGIEAITEAISIQFPKTLDTISTITQFAVATTPFGILNLLFGKSSTVIIDKLRYRIESFYKDFWDSASTYIRDLFKWIQLKDIVNPVTGLATGFINFVAQKYGSFIRQFTGASSVSEESEVTQSSILATTVTIFSRLTSTLAIKPIPIIVADKILDVAGTIRQNNKTTEDEYETITEGGVRTRTVTKRVKESSVQASGNTSGSDSSGAQSGAQSSGSTSAGASNDPRIVKYVKYVIAHAHKKSQGRCAAYVRQALNSAGFYNRSGKDHGSAYMYHSNGIMASMGFKLVYSGAQNGYSTPAGLKTGDVIVWDRVPNHKHGHISITINDSGKQCSDFIQNNFCIAVNYSKGGRYHVYRLPAVGGSSSGSSSSSGTLSATAHKAPTKTAPKSSNKNGTGGQDTPISKLKDENGQKVTVKPEPKMSSSNSGLMTESEFSLSEIYTAANGSPIIKVVSDTKTVIARFNRASSGHISVAPESPRLTPDTHDIVMHSKQPRHTSGTLPEQSGPRISETPGRHPLDLLLSSDILGNMGTFTI